MELKITIETTFEDGRLQTCEIGRICRPLSQIGSGNLGLRMDDAKNLLARLQEALLYDQIDEALDASRNCNDCGKRRAIHVDRGRSLDTLYGRFRVKAPRLGRSEQGDRDFRR